MTTTEAIKQLQTEHDLIANERELDGSQFAPALLEALAMAIEMMRCSEIPNCSEPKCADGCIYGWGSSECEHCDYRSEEPDCISRQAAIDIERRATVDTNPEHFESHQKFVEFMDDAEISSLGRWQWSNGFNTALTAVGIDLKRLPSAQPEIIRCKDCKYWRQQTNYAGAPLSFGFCESDEMWRSLYGETYEVSHIDTDDDFYCGYAERRTE